jgi:putative transposase
MLVALVVLLRTLGLLSSGHRTVALENLALRQQLAVFKRTAWRPLIHRGDRLFWVLLAKAWQDWRTPLIVVQPDTVVRWHRQWLRRREEWLSPPEPQRPHRASDNPPVLDLQLTSRDHTPDGSWRYHGRLEILGQLLKRLPLFPGREHTDRANCGSLTCIDARRPG